MREVRIDTEGTDVFDYDAVRAWGKIPGTADNALITQMIKSARQLQEQWTGRSYILKTLTVHYDQLDGLQIQLPFGPIGTISSIKRVYEDGSLSDALVEGTDFFISGMDFKVVNLYKRWSSSGGQIQTGMRAAYACGHGSGDGEVDLPEPLYETLMRHVITDYDMRDDLEVVNPVLYDWVKEALAPYRLETWL